MTVVSKYIKYIKYIKLYSIRWCHNMHKNWDMIFP